MKRWGSAWQKDMYRHNNLFIKKLQLMAHIDLGYDLPGIRAPMAYRPETARPPYDQKKPVKKDGKLNFGGLFISKG